jgi:protein-S-isoprenylcysteine O-methyltransferase Ste14
MDQELLFRLIMGIILFISASISVYFRITAQKRSQDQIDRRLEGGFTMITLRLAGILIWLTIIVYLIYPPVISWAILPLPILLRWLGVAGGITSALLLVWMFRSLGMNITDSVSTRRNHNLVTEGPYRWVRHPLYTFGGLLFLSISMIMSTWLVPLLGIPTYMLLIHRTSIEEKQLQDRFGEEYLEYSQRTGRFLPRLG